MFDHKISLVGLLLSERKHENHWIRECPSSQFQCLRIPLLPLLTLGGVQHPHPEDFTPKGQGHCQTALLLGKTDARSGDRGRTELKDWQFMFMYALGQKNVRKTDKPNMWGKALFDVVHLKSSGLSKSASSTYVTTYSQQTNGEPWPIKQAQKQNSKTRDVLWTFCAERSARIS